MQHAFIQLGADPSTLLLLCLAIPATMTLLAPLQSVYRKTFYALAGAAALLNLALVLLNGYSPQAITFGRFIAFSLDRYSYLFLAVVNLCWFITLIYSYSYVRHRFQQQADRFHERLAIAIALVLATGSSGNLFTLLLFYALSAVAVLPLLTAFTPSHRPIGGLYVSTILLPLFLIVAPTCASLGILFTPFPSLDIRTLGLSDTQAGALLAMFVIFLTKNCVAPFNYWLPRTAFAPAPVSALIHTIGAVQTGTIALIKICAYGYGFDYLAKLNDSFFATGWLTYLCGFTALYTAYRAWKTTNLKERFSYSTVGQLSYIITAILTGTKAAMLGAILHIVSHSFAKMTLFFNAGLLATMFRATETFEVAKFAPRVPWIAFSIGVTGLSISGFPLLAGYYSKDLMLIEELSRQHYAAAFFLLAGGLINVAYIFPILRAAYWPRIKALLKHSPLECPPLAPVKVPFSMAAACVMGTLLVLFFSQYVFLVIRVASTP